MQRILALSVACVCAQVGGPAAAEAAAREIPLSSASGEALAAFRHGRDLYESSREAEAQGSFEKAVAADPRFAFAHAMLARCLSGDAASREMDAAATLAGPLGESEQVMVAYWRALQRGNDAAADAALVRLEQIAADDWRVELLVGERAVDEGRGVEAVRLFRRAVELNPQAAEAYNHLGFALSDLGQHDAAITAMRRYAALKRDDPNPHDSLGEVLLRAGRLADAEVSFRRAGQNPNFWYAAAGVATARFLRSDFEGGRVALRDEEGRAPDPAVRVRLRVLEGWSFFAEGRRAEGLSALERAEQQAQTAVLPALQAQVMLTRAAFHVLAGEGDTALPLLQAAAAYLAGKRVSGADQNAVRRAAGTWRVRALAATGRAGEAAQALRALEAEAGPGGRAALAAVQGLRPVVSQSRGDRDGALRETAACAPMDWLCRGQRVRLLEERGDGAAVGARRALLEERRRDTIWTDLMPSYLWTWSQLRPAATARN